MTDSSNSTTPGPDQIPNEIGSNGVVIIKRTSRSFKSAKE